MFPSRSALIDPYDKWRQYVNNNTYSSKSHIHVKNPFSGNISMRLRMYIESIVIEIQAPFLQRVYETLETQYGEFQ